MLSMERLISWNFCIRNWIGSYVKGITLEDGSGGGSSFGGGAILIFGASMVRLIVLFPQPNFLASLSIDHSPDL